MSEESKEYDIGQIPDTRPLPDSEAADMLDGEESTPIKRLAVFLSMFTPPQCHALCLVLAGLVDATSLEEMAARCGISRRTFFDRIERSKITLQKRGGPGVTPGIGSSSENHGNDLITNTRAKRATNARSETSAKPVAEPSE